MLATTVVRVGFGHCAGALTRERRRSSCSTAERAQEIARFCDRREEILRSTSRDTWGRLDETLLLLSELIFLFGIIIFRCRRVIGHSRFLGDL